jgi:hypothetical protein
MRGNLPESAMPSQPALGGMRTRDHPEREAELIRIAVRHDLLGAPADQQERAQRRGRLLAAMGKLDSSAYPADYLDELGAQWRSSSFSTRASQ